LSITAKLQAAYRRRRRCSVQLRLAFSPMSEAARAVLLAGLIGIGILLGPIALAAAGAIDVGAMFAIQAGLLLAIYLLAVALRNRRDDD